MRRRKRWLEQLSSALDKERDLADKTGGLSESALDHVNANKDTGLVKEKSSPGRPLDADIRQEMERYLEQDLSDVRVHTDANANQAAKLRKAKAFTRGSDIYFGHAQYDPSTKKGLKSLAHELTHVVQTGGRLKLDLDRFEKPQSQIEQEADLAAENMAMGRKPQISVHATEAEVLREKTEEETVPTTTMHSFAITPAFSKGEINAGPFSISFRYVVTEGTGETTLLLGIPDGVQAAFTPIGSIGRDAYKVDDPGGDKARTVKIVVPTETGEIPRLRVTFSNGTASYIVNFQFPG